MSSIIADNRSTALGYLPARFRVEPLTDFVFFQEGPGLRKWQWTEDGMKVINGRNILTDGRIDLNNSERYISQIEFEDKYSHFAIDVGDIVVTSSGTIGKVGRIRAEHLPLMMNTSVIRFHPHADAELDPDYLFAFLRSPQFLNQADSFAVGSAQLNFGPAHLKQMKIVVPSIGEQRRIVSILTAYDRLIENNRKRIQLLEQAARLLYKEWFVHLRFPGHEHVTIIDGVPEGWEKKTLGEIADITMGQSPKSIYYNEDGSGLPFHQGVTNFGIRFPSHQTYCTVQNRLAQPGDILFSVRAPVGRINITTDKIVIGRGLSAIRSKLDQQNLLFYALKSHFFKEDMMGGGVIFASVTKKDLHEVDLLQAPDRISEMFMEHVRPVDLQIENLYRTIENLTQARDQLLPRLMNGTVTV